MENDKPENVTREGRIAEMHDLAENIADYDDLDYFMKVFERAIRHGVFESESEVRALHEFVGGVSGVFGDIGRYARDGHDVNLTWSLIARALLGAFYENKRGLHDRFVP